MQQTEAISKSNNDLGTYDLSISKIQEIYANYDFICRRDVVEILLNAGASLSDETKSGNTPIHIAAQNGYYDIVNTFAKFGANMRMVIEIESFMR